MVSKYKIYWLLLQDVMHIIDTLYSAIFPPKKHHNIIVITYNISVLVIYIKIVDYII